MAFFKPSEGQNKDMKGEIEKEEIKVTSKHFLRIRLAFQICKNTFF